MRPCERNGASGEAASEWSELKRGAERRRAPNNEKLDLGNFHGGIIASAFLYDEIGKG